MDCPEVAGSGSNPVSSQVSRIHTFETPGELHRKFATMEAALFRTVVLSLVHTPEAAAVPNGSVEAELVGEKLKFGFE